MIVLYIYYDIYYNYIYSISKKIKDFNVTLFYYEFSMDLHI